MASSRWKRFGFFDRKSLNLPSEVLEDLILPNQGPSNGGRVESVGQVVGDSELSIRDSISLVMSTAGLPLSSKPLVQENDTATTTETALSGMWSTLTACSPIDLQNERSTIQLPNQSLQSFDGNSTAGAEKSSVAMDGLVLIFAASRNTDFVHCFDVTVRCNPPDNLLEKDLEDMDGWRGYFAPMRNLGSQQESGARTTEDRIINEHLDARADRQAEGIVGISTCRNQSGQLHMACISNKDVVVCVDPHLSLSWYVSFSSTPSTIRSPMMHFSFSPHASRYFAFFSILSITEIHAIIFYSVVAVLCHSLNLLTHQPTSYLLLGVWIKMENRGQLMSLLGSLRWELAKVVCISLHTLIRTGNCSRI